VNRSSKAPTARQIRQHIQAYYARLFNGHTAPSTKLPIPLGKDLAQSLLYPLDALLDLPDRLWEHFLPCGNPLHYVRPSAGDSILNLGSGAGIDSIALARVCKSPIHIVNLDVVSQALVQSRAALSELGVSGFDSYRSPMPLRGTSNNQKAQGDRFSTRNPKLETRKPSEQSRMSFVCGDGSCLPFHPATFDWILMNGVLNLFPDKQKLLTEIRHTLKGGGRLVVMDLCASAELPEYFEGELDGWAWCMSGANTKSQLIELVESAGLSLKVFSENEEMDLLYRMGFLAQKTS
jgi:ubiquinone/menaquinone biosynthesis C-methylase UbiE